MNGPVLCISGRMGGVVGNGGLGVSIKGRSALMMVAAEALCVYQGERQRRSLQLWHHH